MREHGFLIDGALKNGIAQYESVGNNAPYLHEAQNLKCFQTGLVAPERITGVGDWVTWPFPQFFQGEDCAVLAGEDTVTPAPGGVAGEAYDVYPAYRPNVFDAEIGLHDPLDQDELPMAEVGTAMYVGTSSELPAGNYDVRVRFTLHRDAGNASFGLLVVGGAILLLEEDWYNPENIYEPDVEYTLSGSFIKESEGEVSFAAYVLTPPGDTEYVTADFAVEVRAGETELTSGGDPWQFASFQDCWFLTNGTNFVFKIPSDVEVLTADGLNVNALCANNNRLLLGGLSGDWFDTPEWDLVVQAWIETVAPKSFVHKDLGFDVRWSVWGERGGGARDYPFHALLAMLGVFGEDGFESLFEVIVTAIEAGEIGLVPSTDPGPVVALKPWEGGVMAYNTGECTKLVENGPLYEPVRSWPFGLEMACHVAGDQFEHVFLDSRGVICQAANGDVRELGYERLMEPDTSEPGNYFSALAGGEDPPPSPVVAVPSGTYNIAGAVNVSGSGSIQRRLVVRAWPSGGVVHDSGWVTQAKGSLVTFTGVAEVSTANEFLSAHLAFSEQCAFSFMLSMSADNDDDWPVVEFYSHSVWSNETGFMGDTNVAVAPWVLSFDATTRDYWVSSGAQAWLLSRYGMSGPMDVRPTALARVGGVLIGAALGLDETEYPVRVASWPVDMNTEGTKHLTELQLWHRGLSDLVGYCEYWDGDDYVASPEVPFNDHNVSFPHASFTAARVVVEGKRAAGALVSVTKIDARYQTEDKRFHRGTYGVAKGAEE